MYRKLERKFVHSLVQVKARNWLQSKSNNSTAKKHEIKKNASQYRSAWVLLVLEHSGPSVSREIGYTNKAASEIEATPQLITFLSWQWEHHGVLNSHHRA